MTKEKALSLISNAQKELKTFLDGVAPQFEGMTPQQLSKCQLQLETMKQHIEKEIFVDPTHWAEGMGKMIVDSWPLGTQIGQALIAAEDAYLRIQKRRRSSIRTKGMLK